MYIRSLFTWQKILEEESEILKNLIFTEVDKMELEGEDYGELAIIFIYYQEEEKANTYISLTKQYNSLEFEFTGVSGTKTQYQKTKFPLLSIDFKQSDPSEFSDKKLACLFTFIYHHQAFFPLEKSMLEYFDLILSTVEKHSKSEENIRALSQIKALLDSKNALKIDNSAIRLSSILEHMPKERPNIDLFFLLNITSLYSIAETASSLYNSLGVYKAAKELAKKWEITKEYVSALLSLKENNLVIQEVEKELIRNGESPEILCSLGMASNDISHYKRALELTNGTHPLALRSLAEECCKLGLFEESEKYTRKYLNLFPQSEKMLFLLGCCQRQGNRLDEALESFRRVVCIDEEFLSAYLNITSIYIAKDLPYDALATLYKAAKISYDSKSVWNNILKLSIAIQESVHAICAYERCLEIEQENTDTYIFIEIIKQARGNNLSSSSIYSQTEERVFDLLFGKDIRKPKTSHDFWLEVFSILKNTNKDTILYRIVISAYKEIRSSKPNTKEEFFIYTKVGFVIANYRNTVDESSKKSILEYYCKKILLLCSKFSHTEEYSKLESLVN
eukprot:GHVP01020820.1.p1 GENE.GHVP01020820.1~~GHVP01020820.1.p1  ORF type:complete len:647 (+),score=113.63 GHVP01020820.1:250-1941(+)